MSVLFVIDVGFKSPLMILKHLKDNIRIHFFFSTFFLHFWFKFRFFYYFLIQFFLYNFPLRVLRQCSKARVCVVLSSSLTNLTSYFVLVSVCLKFTKLRELLTKITKKKKKKVQKKSTGEIANAPNRQLWN